MTRSERKNEIYDRLFERLKDLLAEITDAGQELEDCRQRYENLRKSRNHLKTYIESEIVNEDDEVERDELQEVLNTILEAPQYTVETFMDPDLVRKDRSNKTQQVIWFLMHNKLHSGNEGLTPKELYTKLQATEEGKTIPLNYVNNILSRFRSMGRLGQLNGKYFMTQDGVEYWNRVTGGELENE